MGTYIYLLVIFIIFILLLFLALIIFKNGWDILKKIFKK